MPTGQTSHMGLWERGCLPKRVARWGAYFIVPHPTAVPLKKQDTSDSLKTRSIWRSLEHTTLWEVPSRVSLTASPHCLPKCFWGPSTASLSSAKSAPPKGHWFPGFILFEDLGSLQPLNLTMHPVFNMLSLIESPWPRETRTLSLFPRWGNRGFHPFRATLPWDTEATMAYNCVNVVTITWTHFILILGTGYHLKKHRST